MQRQPEGTIPPPSFYTKLPLPTSSAAARPRPTGGGTPALDSPHRQRTSTESIRMMNWVNRSDRMEHWARNSFSSPTPPDLAAVRSGATSASRAVRSSARDRSVASAASAAADVAIAAGRKRAQRKGGGRVTRQEDEKQAGREEQRTAASGSSDTNHGVASGSRAKGVVPAAAARRKARWWPRRTVLDDAQTVSQSRPPLDVRLPCQFLQSATWRKWLPCQINMNNAEIHYMHVGAPTCEPRAQPKAFTSTTDWFARTSIFISDTGPGLARQRRSTDVHSLRDRSFLAGHARRWRQ